MSLLPGFWSQRLAVGCTEYRCRECLLAEPARWPVGMLNASFAPDSNYQCHRRWHFQSKLWCLRNQISRTLCVRFSEGFSVHSNKLCSSPGSAPSHHNVEVSLLLLVRGGE